MVGRRARGRVRFADDPEPEDPWGPDEQQNTVQDQVATQPQQIQPSVHPVPQRQQSVPMPGIEPAWQPRGNTVSMSEAILSASRPTSPPMSNQDSSKQKGTARVRTGKTRQYPAMSQPEQHKQQLPLLQNLCLGVLSRHVVQLVEQLHGQLGFLPADVKAALLAVARRRGEMNSRVLSSLADPEWIQLDLSHCKRLCAAEVLQAAPLMPNIQVLDVTGFDHLAAGGWKQFARAWPALSVLRLGGSQICSQEALKALPYILPGLPQPTAASAACSTRHGEVGPVVNASSGQNVASTAGQPVATAEEEQGLSSWEDAFDSDNDEEDNTQQDYSLSPHNTVSSAGLGSTMSSAAAAGQDCRLKKLRALIWPDVPPEAVDFVQQRCPKVLINPPMKRDKMTGQMPPQELNGSVPLDQRFVELVGAEALNGAVSSSPLQQQSGDGGLSIADKFAMAYVQQAARLREKERRLREQEQKRQLRSSHALRTLEKWLDEPA